MTLAAMDSSHRHRVDDRTRGQHRVRVVTVIAAVGSGVLATVLSVLLTGSAATASTTTNTPTQQNTQDTQSNQGTSDQLQAPDQTPAQTYTGGGHASSGGT